MSDSTAPFDDGTVPADADLAADVADPKKPVTDEGDDDE